MTSPQTGDDLVLDPMKLGALTGRLAQTWLDFEQVWAGFEGYGQSFRVEQLDLDEAGAAEIVAALDNFRSRWRAWLASLDGQLDKLHTGASDALASYQRAERENSCDLRHMHPRVC
jgi:hypothetical protein